MRRGRIPYSADEMAWLEANYRLVISDYHRAFVEQFGREDVSASHLNQLRKRKGWKVGRDGARYRGRLRTFNAAETEWLSANRTLSIKEYLAGFQAVFGRPDVTERKLHALRKSQDWKTGRTGCFEKGSVAHNKGKKCAPGTGGRHPNAQRTQFQQGQRTGIAQKNYKPIGYERISVDGYRERKVNDDLPFKDRWQLVQRLEWEAANGPIPEGHALKCLDGDKLNCDPSNWEPVHRGVLARLNGGRFRKTLPYDAAPAELKPTVMAVAKLKHAAHELRKGSTTPRIDAVAEGEQRGARG